MYFTITLYDSIMFEENVLKLSSQAARVRAYVIRREWVRKGLNLL